MHTFNPNTQLLKGAHSIEASAGTGKTYSITILWLRLLIEEHLSIEQILVSTFTKAATAELKDRLLTSLRNALNVAKAIQADTPPLECGESAIIQRAIERNPNAIADLVRRLSSAVSSFDLAPISTIHGFCQSLISRHALELGCDAGLPLVPDCQELLHQVIDDQIMLLADDPSTNPEELRRIALTVADHLDAPRLIANPQILDALERLRLEIANAANAAIESTKKGSSRIAFARKVQTLVDTGVWEEVKGPQAIAVGAEFLTLWNRYRERQLQVARLPAGRIAAAIAENFPKRKIAAGLRSFDDILETVQSALTQQGDEGPLAQAVRKRFQAAIIDECQDSDGIQINVFAKLFAHKDTKSFIVIGDPKQSIYRFRGADLASYKLLAKKAEKAPQMVVNHRSDPALIAALNALYGAEFIFPDTLSAETTYYIPVSAQATSARITDPANLPALVFHWAQADSSAPAKSTLAGGLAAECVRLLESKVTIEDRQTKSQRALRPADIAVLAAGHLDLQLVRRALNQVGLPCQSSGKSLGSVFGSDEAKDILSWLSLLTALQTRGDVLSHLVTFLGTPLGGFTPEALLELREDAQTQASQGLHFQSIALELHRSGPLPLLLQHLSSELVVEANLPFIDAERRFTNWQQIAALLQHEHSRGRRGPHALALWLSRQILAKPEAITTDDDSEQSALMRLETDSDAIQLLTIHNSKGLEFPIVFCPFLWSVRSSVSRTNSPAAVFRAPEGWVLDLGSDQFSTNQALAMEQEDEEEHRKLYVALTRARHRLYVGVAPVSSSGGRFDNSAQKSALAHLLHLDATESVQWREALDRVPYSTLRECTSRAMAPERIGNPAESSASLLSPPPLLPTYQAPFHRTHSFSSLSKSDEEYHLPADRDAEQTTPPLSPSPKDDLLRHLGDPGAILGDQLHSLLEHYLGNRRELADILEGMRDEAEWRTALTQILGTLISLPDGRQLTLESIRTDCITEMQFHLPVGRLHPEALSRALLADESIQSSPLRAAWALEIADWSFGQFAGYLQGYIDLIFEHEGRWYVADYKSNRLNDYSANELEAVMLQKNYLLQARFYALALHRHLSVQLEGYDYASHFGGVVYLFVRGLPGEGVWFDRPSESALRQLGSFFQAAP